MFWRQKLQQAITFTTVLMPDSWYATQKLRWRKLTSYRRCINTTKTNRRVDAVVAAPRHMCVSMNWFGRMKTAASVAQKSEASPKTKKGEIVPSYCFQSNRTEFVAAQRL